MTDTATRPQMPAHIAAAAAAAGCPHAHATTPQSKLPSDALESAAAVSVGANGGSTGILLVNHGSRSIIWRRMLLDVHAQVADELLSIPDVGQVRTGYMEYTEPSIASQLKAFDEAGITDVLVVPLLLTISDHSFDDIPAICGQSDDHHKMRELVEEGIEIYRPKARVQFSPLLDFSGLVRTNLARRVGKILGHGAKPDAKTGLVLIGYGSQEFDDEWNAFFEQTRLHAEEDLGVSASTHAWCGHLVEYNKQPTIDAINAMLEVSDQVVVVPQLVAYDPMFQERIIGKAVKQSNDPSRVLYSSDSILPEPEVGNWIVRISNELVPALSKGAASSS
ncbi:MAG: hypothetical protein KF844_08535 [Cryobacterium sp.]|nr:hypothetical protein [Cryobacterium sp.]